MGVSENDSVQPANAFPQALNPELRRSIDRELDLRRLDKNGGTRPIVLWIGEKFGRILLADDRHTLRRAGAQESEGEHCIKRPAPTPMRPARNRSQTSDARFAAEPFARGVVGGILNWAF